MFIKKRIETTTKKYGAIPADWIHFFDDLKGDEVTDAKIELIEPDYEGISKVLNEFEKLYKVCENKKLLDKCLESFCNLII